MSASDRWSTPSYGDVGPTNTQDNDKSEGSLKEHQLEKFVGTYYGAKQEMEGDAYRE